MAVEWDRAKAHLNMPATKFSHRREQALNCAEEAYARGDMGAVGRAFAEAGAWKQAIELAMEQHRGLPGEG